MKISVALFVVEFPYSVETSVCVSTHYVRTHSNKLNMQMENSNSVGTSNVERKFERILRIVVSLRVGPLSSCCCKRKMITDNFDRASALQSESFNMIEWGGGGW